MSSVKITNISQTMANLPLQNNGIVIRSWVEATPILVVGNKSNFFKAAKGEQINKIIHF